MKKAILLVLALLALNSTTEMAKADFTFGTPTDLGPTVNSASTEWGPSISADGLELYFGSWRSGGFGEEDIYVTTRATTSDPWGEAVNLGPTVNSSSWDQTPSISTDGLTLYFCSDRPGGGEDLWITTRETKDDPWRTPVNLGPTVNSQGTNWMPSISADGLELYFCSDRSGGYGLWDIWVTKRETIHDGWGPPMNLGPTVNSAHRDLSISISHDGLLLFFDSDRPGGSGGHDLWLTRRETTDDPWGTPVNLGPTVNSSCQYDQTPSISADGSTLYFTSERPGDLGGGDIYQVSIIPIVDFNADGKVDGLEVGRMAGCWGTDDSSCDIGPMPWGDGVVDLEDLKVLAKYIGEDFEDPALIAHWAFDETEGMTAADSAGDKNGTVVGLAVWRAEDGKVGGALEFDGLNDFVLAGVPTGLGDGPFSVLAWVKGGTPGQVVLCQQTGADWLLANPIDGSLMTQLVNPGRFAVPLFSDVVITDGQWHRIALVWDGANRMLYVDGEQVACDEQASVTITTGGLVIGGAMTPGTFWSGLIDDVRIYNRAVRP